MKQETQHLQVILSFGFLDWNQFLFIFLYLRFFYESFQDYTPTS